MHLLEPIAEIVVGHVEHPQAAAPLPALEIFPLVVAHDFAPEGAVFLARQPVPGALAPGVAQLHQLVVHALGILQQCAR